MALEYLGMLTFRLFHGKNRHVTEDKNGDKNMKSDQVGFPLELYCLGIQVW